MTKQPNQDIDPRQASQIEDAEKARFVAYAEKPYRDEALTNREKADLKFAARIAINQLPGADEIKWGHDLMGSADNAWATKAELEDAVGGLQTAQRLENEAAQMGDVAGRVYDRLEQQGKLEEAYTVPEERKVQS